MNRQFSIKFLLLAIASLAVLAALATQFVLRPRAVKRFEGRIVEQLSRKRTPIAEHNGFTGHVETLKTHPRDKRDTEIIPLDSDEIAKLEKLRSLSFYRNSFLIGPLVNLPQLRILMLHDCEVEDLERLTELDELEFLFFSHINERLSDKLPGHETLAFLAFQESGTILFDSDFVVTELNKTIDFEELEPFPALKQLWISQQLIDNFRGIEKLGSLVMLQLFDCNIRSFEGLERAKSLEILWATRINDDRIGEICKLTQLKHLITKEEFYLRHKSMLEQCLPNCRIHVTAPNALFLKHLDLD